MGRLLQDLGRVLQKKWAEFCNGPGSPGPGSPAGRVHLIPQSTVVSTKIKRCHDVGDGAIGWVENALVVGIKSHIWSPGTFTRIFVYCISVSWSWAFTKYNNFPGCVKFSSCKLYGKKIIHVHRRSNWIYFAYVSAFLSQSGSCHAMYTGGLYVWWWSWAGPGPCGWPCIYYGHPLRGTSVIIQPTVGLFDIQEGSKGPNRSIGLPQR